MPEVLSANAFSLYQNGKRVEEDIRDDLPLDVVFEIPGGKGGFGSMLRALGAKIEKNTNKDACRDLSGRRLRDINEEERLKKYVASQAAREQEAAQKKKARLEKLERLVKGENKHEFHDPKYDKAREESTDRVHESIEAAMKKKKATHDAQPQASTSGVKRKIDDPPAATVSQPKKGLWMGVDLNDSDLETSSDEEDTEKSKQVSAAAK
eukprot:snap_masked-scaffold476_size161517-processed-gene-0.29 protein:Tk11961 transcript:snap_masked-scaffold476_size161517-processed-gene-0.29-mRNA-1 annotation:"c1orf55 homolog"